MQIYTICIIIDFLNSLIVKDYDSRKVENKHEPVEDVSSLPDKLKLCNSTCKGGENV